MKGLKKFNCNLQNKGICPSNVYFEVDNEQKLHNIEFTGGCLGNLKTISKLLENTMLKDAVLTLKGITCGKKDTSCSNEFAIFLEKVQKVYLDKKPE
jgi:uncharacterized protein (TIGR03905 family)